jgi:hypothetical protein
MSHAHLRRNLRTMDARFQNVFGHTNLLIMSNESTPADFRIYIELSRELRRRQQLTPKAF